jgi:hypothetical protein
MEVAHFGATLTCAGRSTSETFQLQCESIVLNHRLIVVIKIFFDDPEGLTLLINVYIHHIFFQENKSQWCSTTCIDPLSTPH